MKPKLLLITALFFIYFGFTKYKQETFCVKIPVQIFSCGNKPVIDISIEGQNFSMLIDSGSVAALVLDEPVLDNLSKKPFKTLSRTDFRGNTYYFPSYFIPKVSVGTFIWKNVLTEEKSPDLEQNVVFEKPKNICPNKEKIRGFIGLPLLKKTNILLDFPNQALYLCNSLKMLQKNMLLSNKLIKIPFTIENDFILVEAEINSQKEKLLFDTGAGICAIHRSGTPTLDLTKDAPPLYIFSDCFVLSGHDFGKQSFAEIDMSFAYGILGMDFIEKFPIYIDYKNKTLYVDISGEK